MSILQWALPVAILVFGFTVKMVVDRNVRVPHFIFSVLELPVDVMFLSITMTASLVISNEQNRADMLVLFILYSAVTVISVLCWRKSLSFYETTRYKVTVVVGVLNYFLGLACLIFVIGLLGE